MRLTVIDASVALKWVLDEPGSDAASALCGENLSAPALWQIEAANALWLRVRKRLMTAEEVTRRLVELRGAPVATSPPERDVDEALRIACALNHSVYDCLYLAAALREGADVVTADAKFAAVAANHPNYAARVRLLGN